MVQESWLDTVCTTEKLKPRSAIKGTLRGVRGGENSPYSISPIDFMLRMNLRKQYNMKMELLKSLFAAVVALAASSLQAKTRPFKKRDKLK